MESLAVKYRPKEWEHVVEQSAVVEILKKQIELDKIRNCYLFCGATGSGKTTLSRLFANKINNNQGSPIELDAASNNGVDNVRQIIKAAQERSLDSKYKVYIIDEAHALSNSAWQAFLKCIEEPPEFTIFIFCTTDPQKIPATILNRVQRFNISRISTKGIHDRLQYVCAQENFINYNESIDYIAKLADGCMRDALTLLDKCSTFSTDLNINNVLKCIGTFSYDTFFNLINSMIDGDEKSILSILNDYYESGMDMKLFLNQFIDFVIDVAKYCIFKNCDIIRIPKTFEDILVKTIAIEGANKYFQYVMNKLLDLKNMIKNDTSIRSTIEIMFIQIARCN